MEMARGFDDDSPLANRWRPRPRGLASYRTLSRGSLESCSAVVGRVITTVVLPVYMAGFEVTTYGRFWDDH